MSLQAFIPFPCLAAFHMTRPSMRERTAPRGKNEVGRNAVKAGTAGASTDLRNGFGAGVRKLRLRRNLTQEALAEASDLSVDAVRRIEAGRFSPTLDTLRKLSTGLEISLPTLFQSIGDDRPDHVAEICDYLSRRSGRELKLAWKVLHAMFDDR